MNFISYLLASIVFSLIIIINLSSAIPPSICLYHKDPGPCKASFKKWYFDARTSQCVSFIYGGCGGNDNRFDSFEECVEECKPKDSGCYDEAENESWEHYKRPDECYERRSRGSWCRAREMPFTQYYFDEHDEECKPFGYKGCKGTNNRFPSLQDCVRTCQPRNMPDPDRMKPSRNKLRRNAFCHLPWLDDPCKEDQQESLEQRYYFDWLTGLCVLRTHKVISQKQKKT